MDIDKELETVDRAYGELARALMAAQAAAEWQATAKCDLDTARATALVSGEIDGKNEATREALLRQKLASHYSGLSAAEKYGREMRHAADLAQLEVERIRLRVRLMELASGRERLAA